MGGGGVAAREGAGGAFADGPEAVLARVGPLLGRVGLRALLRPCERGFGASAASCRRTVRESSERVAAHPDGLRVAAAPRVARE